MFFIIRLLCALFLLTQGTANASVLNNQGVTYQLTGRLGNNLIAYFHAKWISYKYGLPLIFKPFKYSDEFAFHDLEENTLQNLESTFDVRVTLEDLSLLRIQYPNLLFVVPYFRDVGPQPENRVPIRFYTDWEDPGFKEILLSHLKPKVPLNCIVPPSDKISVLVHIRTGGDFDTEAVKLKLPLKFPPLSYYVQALRKISQHFNHVPIYAFILTDDSNPKKLANMMRRNLPKRDNIEFQWRRGESGHNVNVLDDFFSIPNFNCLIRADSTFSEMAARLGDYKVVVSPLKGHVQNDRVIIDEIEFKTKR